MAENIEERVIASLAETKRIPRERITPATSLEELGLDSLDVINLLFQLEEEFHVSIPDEDARSLHTVRAIIEKIDQLQAKPATQSAEQK